MSEPNVDLIAEEYSWQGYSIAEGLFSVSKCQAIRALAERLSSFQSGEFMPVMNPHKEVPELLKIMGDERLLRVMRRLMKGEPVGLQTQCFFCRPGQRGLSAHQDNHYVQAPPERFASAWLALDDADNENGGLIVLPGSHAEPLLDVRPIDLRPGSQSSGMNCHEGVRARGCGGSPRRRGLPAQPRRAFIKSQLHFGSIPASVADDIPIRRSALPSELHRQERAFCLESKRWTDVATDVNRKRNEPAAPPALKLFLPPQLQCP